MPRNFQLHLRPKLFRCNSIGRFNEILPTLLKRYDCTRFNGSMEFNLSERKLVFVNPFAKIPWDCSTLSLLRVNALLSEISFSSLSFICIFSILFCDFILSKNRSFRKISGWSIGSFETFFTRNMLLSRKLFTLKLFYFEILETWILFPFGFTKILRRLISWFEIFRNFLSSQLSTLKFPYLASFLFDNYVISKFLKIWDSFHFKKTSRRAISWLEIFCPGISLFTNVLALIAFHSKTLSFWNFAKFQVPLLLIFKRFKGGTTFHAIYLIQFPKLLFLIELQNIAPSPVFLFHFNQKNRKVSPTRGLSDLTNRSIRRFSN